MDAQIKYSEGDDIEKIESKIDIVNSRFKYLAIPVISGIVSLVAYNLIKMPELVFYNLITGPAGIFYSIYHDYHLHKLEKKLESLEKIAEYDETEIPGDEYVQLPVGFELEQTVGAMQIHKPVFEE